VEAAARRFKKERRGRGRPPVPAVDVAKAVLLQQYFGTANRQTEGLLLLFREKLGLSQEFSYKTIERAYENPQVVALLDQLFELTQDSIRNLETGLGVDATGLPKSVKKNYADDKTPDGAEMTQTTLGLTTLMLTRIVLLRGRAEVSTFPDAMRGAETYTALEKVVGDAAYLSRTNCDLVEDLDATPYFFPKRGLSFKRLGSDAWIHMLRAFLADPQRWLHEYHPRSLLECFNRVWKHDFPAPLARRRDRRRATEILARGIDYNLKRSGYLRHMIGLVPSWWQGAA
jgi:transposase